MMRSTLFAGGLLVAVPVLSAFAGGEIAGPARVVDGDTLVIGEQHIRLDGIDAPETDQVCLDAAGKRWTCGIAARDQLARRIGSAPVSCAAHGQDRYGRVLADCSVGGESLNAWMTRQGWALAYVHYSQRYAGDEAGARQARRGLWSGAFIAPWNWRHRDTGTTILGALSVPVTAQAELLSPASAKAAPSSDCTIKGNINGRGERIYHRPGQKFYAATKIDTRTGERWFCTEAEAVAAGWRPARH
jgi:endonuclease YncB( thermonuclease family)